MAASDTPHPVVPFGGYASISMLPKIYKFFKGLPMKDLAALKRIMTIYCKHGPAELKPAQFKTEGRWPIGRNPPMHVQLHAFKNGQIRVYGGLVVDSEGRQMFVCTESTVKKTQKADQDQLQRAAHKLAPYIRREGSKQ